MLYSIMKRPGPAVFDKKRNCSLRKKRSVKKKKQQVSKKKMYERR